MNPPCDEATAYHEAGHAVVALILGRPVDEVNAHELIGESLSPLGQFQRVEDAIVELIGEYGDDDDVEAYLDAYLTTFRAILGDAVRPDVPKVSEYLPYKTPVKVVRRLQGQEFAPRCSTTIDMRVRLP